MVPRYSTGCIQPVGGMDYTARLEWFDFHLYISNDCDAVIAALGCQL